jgi:hypothetical protein
LSKQTFSAIQKRLQLIIKNWRKLFAEDKFSVESTPIELFGFKWLLAATKMREGFLGLYLHAEPPNGFTGNYRIEVDRLIIRI